MLVFQHRPSNSTHHYADHNHLKIIFWFHHTNTFSDASFAEVLRFLSLESKMFVLCELQGPLFQQRPYPSPGAVLRKNAEIASQKKKPGSQYTPISKRGDGSDGLGDAD